MKCTCLDAQVPKFWRRIAWSQHVLGANPAGLLHQISGSPCRAGSAGCKPLHRWEGALSAGSLGRVKRQQLGAACQKCQGSESQPGKGKGKKQKPRDSSRHWEKGKEKSQNCKCSGARREVRALWATLEEGDWKGWILEPASLILHLSGFWGVNMRYVLLKCSQHPSPNTSFPPLKGSTWLSLNFSKN